MRTDADDALDFDLLIAPENGTYRVRLLSSPSGEARGSFTLPFSDLEIENLVLRMGQVRSGLRGRESPQTEAAREFGRRLFEAVFAGELGTCWQNSAAEAAQEGKRLRLQLRLSDAPELLDLPWEYLYDSVANRFITLSSKTPLVRYLDLPGRIDPLPVHGPLRILALIASPQDMETLDVEHEWNNLCSALADLVAQGAVQIDRCAQPTLAELQRTLRQNEYHIFHFVGHGGYDSREQDGLLLFEDEQRRSRPVSGRQLGALLRDEGQLRLAVLNACEGARTSRTDPFAGVGQSLLQQGVPAVIAMQFAITDTAAAIFAHEFYASIADGFAVDRALAEARKAMFAQSDSVEWGTPVLYLRAAEGRVFDLVTPHRKAAAKAPAAAAAGAGAAQGVQQVPESAAQIPAQSPAQPPAQPAVKRAVEAQESGKRHMPWSVLAAALLLLVIAVGGAGMLLRNGQQVEAAPTGEAAAAAPAAAATMDENAPGAGLQGAVPAATTQASTPSGELPAFRYSFDDGNANGWTGQTDYWQVVKDETGNHVYQGTAPPDSSVAVELPNKATMATWRNYAVHLRLRAVQAGTDPDLAEFWMTTRAPYEETTGCNFYNTILDFRHKVVALGKGGSETECPYQELDSNGYPLLSLEQWHDVVTSMHEDQIEISVDGKKLISVTDGDVKQGYVYLNVGNGATVQIDDVKVVKLDD